MDYCYVAAGGERISFATRRRKCRRTKRFLTEMIGAIGEAADFPLTEEERRCRFCNYRSLCDRARPVICRISTLMKWSFAGF